ncbi:MAG: Gfo/Idh/MocA family protein [Rubripirellula sp.]
MRTTRTSMQPRRRDFLAATAGAIVAPGLVAQAAEPAKNDRLQVGVIGLGSRGYNLVDALVGHHAQARIIAVCDVDATHYRDRPWGTGPAYGLMPAQKKVAEAYAKRGITQAESSISGVSDYREVIARDDIDVVVVATPDHWHAKCTIDALQAGKDVYCEKPVTHLFAEGQSVYREVAKQNAVFQTGSQQRSDWRFRRIVELARNGLFGEIRRVEVGLPPGYEEPQGETQVKDVPKQLDYDFWCGPAPVLPYMRARHHRWWRGHRAYGGGVLMDWIGHHNDIAHWALDLDRSGPSLVEAVNWKFPATDVYNTPADYTIRSEYPGGIQGEISTTHTQGLKLIGSAGWAFVTRGKLLASDDRWTVEAFDPGPIDVYTSSDHMGNFLECVRSRKDCIAPAETAHRSITPGHLGYVSQQLGRPLRWDAALERVTGDEEANRILQEVNYRSPWG